jgi:hypothetical protein
MRFKIRIPPKPGETFSSEANVIVAPGAELKWGERRIGSVISAQVVDGEVEVTAELDLP